MHIPTPLLRIIERLHSAGFQAYVVGGAVRDVSLNRPVTDWDLASSASVEDIKIVFKDQRHFFLKHDTVTLIINNENYEITTFRNGHNTERTIDSDLAHRDFTINAMAYDIRSGEILDPNRGLQDISKRIVRAVGEPDDRFYEDPLRMLRAVRLSSELGFKIHEKTFGSICSLSPCLSSVAQERLRDELMKILLSPKPSKGFDLARRTGVLKIIIPELLEGYRKAQNCYHRFTIYRHIMETVNLVEPTPLLRLAALLHDIAKPRVRKKIEGRFRFYGHEKESGVLARTILARLKFSNDMIGTVVNLIENHMVQYESQWSDGAVRRLIRRVGTENIDDLLMFRKADLIAHGIIDHKLDLLKELAGRVDRVGRSKFPGSTYDLAIGGNEVMEILELSPGQAVGYILDQLLEKVTDSPELNTKENLINLLRSEKIHINKKS